MERKRTKPFWNCSLFPSPLSTTKGLNVNKILLILGASGVGKSSIIKELLAIDRRFIYIVPFTTRPSRGTEDDKISVSNEVMNDLWNRGELLSVNDIHGIRCGTPRLSIMQALKQCKFPVLDWPISRIVVMKQAFPNHLHIVYVSPPSVEVLRQRLTKDKRDIDGSRFQDASKELETYWSSQYIGIYDFEVVSEENQVSKTAHAIYVNYLKLFSSQI